MSRHREWDLECKVYIGNLESETARGDLEGLFSKYGNLKNVWIARNPPGFAFVEFEDPRDAEDAVKELDGTRFCGNKIRVQMSTGRKRQDGGKGDGNRRSPRYEPYKGRNDSNGGRSGPTRRSRSRSPRRDAQSTFKDSRRLGRDSRRSRSRSHTPSDRG